MKKYPKEILEQIRKHLEKEQQKLQKRLELLNLEDPFSNPDRVNDNAASDTDAKEEVDHERIQVLKEDISLNLEGIKQALFRIKKGDYGFCENCKKMINTDRLAAKPTARLCISCQSKKST